jgi:hypothetical protein
LALNSLTSGGRWIGIVRSRTQATEFSFLSLYNTVFSEVFRAGLGFNHSDFMSFHDYTSRFGLSGTVVTFGALIVSYVLNSGVVFDFEDPFGVVARVR